MTHDRITAKEAQALLDGWDIARSRTTLSLAAEEVGSEKREAAPRLARTVVALEEELRQAREGVTTVRALEVILSRLKMDPKTADILASHLTFSRLAAARAQEKADD